MRRSDFFRQNESVLEMLSRALDGLTIWLAGVWAYAVYFQSLEFPDVYKWALIFAAILTLVVFPMFDNYQSWRGRHWAEQFRVVIVSVSTVMAAMVLLSAGMRNTAMFSRSWFAIWFFFSIIGIFTYKRVLSNLLRRLRQRGWNRRRIIIYGAGELGQMVATHHLDAPWAEYEVVCLMDDSPNVETFRRIRVLDGSKVQLTSFIDEHDIQEVWLALPLRAEERMKSILQDLRNTTVAIRFAPNIFGLRLLLGSAAFKDVVGVPVIDLNSSPISGMNYLLKELEDRLLGSLILLLVSPLMLLIAIAIKLESRGPILFKQLRHGWDGKPIKVYKFRSMFIHDEGKRVTQATKNDPRITKVGAFLRRSSLDELPQFFNVIQGRMSVVGPRPHAIAHNEYYRDKVEFYFQRHKVKPGITGWAQVNGLRGETDTLDKMEKRIELDLYYIEHWSLWLDFKIIMLTLVRGFTDDKAY